MDYQTVKTVSGEQVKVTTGVAMDLKAEGVVLVQAGQLLVVLTAEPGCDKIVQTIFRFSNKEGCFMFAGLLDLYATEEGIQADLMGGQEGLEHVGQVRNGIRGLEKRGSGQAPIDQRNIEIDLEFLFRCTK